MKGRPISSTIKLFIFLAKTGVDCKLDFVFSQLFEFLMVSMIFNFGVGVLKLNPQLDTKAALGAHDKGSEQQEKKSNKPFFF